jgi:hypothetical protein
MAAAWAAHSDQPSTGRPTNSSSDSSSAVVREMAVLWLDTGCRDCQWVWLPGQGGECGCDLADSSAHVRGSGLNRAATFRMARVGTGYGITEIALNPGECGVAKPVDRYLLGGNPGKVMPYACPQIVVSASGDRPAGSISEHGGALCGGPLLGVTMLMALSGVPQGRSLKFPSWVDLSGVSGGGG